MPTSQLQHLGEGEAVMMVCSLSSFPRLQPQCSPYKTSPRVCAYEKHRTACAVQCMCTRERLCVCAMAAVASLLVLSSTCRPNSTCRHCTIRWWGWGLCPAQDFLQDQTRAKQGHKKKWLFLQRFLPKVDLASVVSFNVVLCCFEYLLCLQQELPSTSHN